MSKQNHYELLNVKQDASATEIKCKYHKFALELHPDKTNNCPIKTASFQEIGKAYAVLSDPEERKRYDFQLELEKLMSESAKNQEVPSQPQPKSTSNTKFSSNGVKVNINGYEVHNDIYTSNKKSNPIPPNNHFHKYEKIYTALQKGVTAAGISNIALDGHIDTTIFFSYCNLSLLMAANTTEKLMQLPSLSNNKTYLKHEPAIIFSAVVGASSLVPAFNFFRYNKEHISARPGLAESIELIDYSFSIFLLAELAKRAMQISGHIRKPRPSIS